MFTGIIEHMGTVVSITEIDASESGGGGWSMIIGDAASILGDCHIGDSIAVNGCCLTVTEFNEDSFKVGIAPESLRRTNLGDLKVNDKVNLERALSGGTRFGGHFVQGHVDCTATIVSIKPEGNSKWFELELPDQSLLPYLIPKGFIALDGTSLTVCDVDDNKRRFTIMMIAHTQKHVVMAEKQPGDRVNVEMDMVGKYAVKQVEAAIEGMLGDNSKLLERIAQKLERKQ
ncbi:uncharacterized protein VTP21DRAFT_11067 [Calcarisporiella thermophila]|uniref:uncharacterized protein n=1 Tax=Calcarisporiella thermophila TaxID=911321 RepID=UPI0037431DE9